MDRPNTPTEKLTEDEVDRVRRLARVCGVRAAAAMLGVHVETLRRVLGGVEAVHRLTARVVRAALAEHAVDVVPISKRSA